MKWLESRNNRKLNGSGAKRNKDKIKQVKIPRRYKYQDITAPIYQKTIRLEHLDLNFEKLAEGIVRSIGDMDVHNEGYAETLIDSYIDESLSFLDEQRYEHQYTIKRTIMNLYREDLEIHKAELADALKEKQQYEEELRILKLIHEKGTVYEQLKEERGVIG